jgi:hypothetical protein
MLSSTDIGQAIQYRCGAGWWVRECRWQLRFYQTPSEGIEVLDFLSCQVLSWPMQSVTHGSKTRHQHLDVGRPKRMPKRRHSYANGLSPVKFEINISTGRRASTEAGVIHRDAFFILHQKRTHEPTHDF